MSLANLDFTEEVKEINNYLSTLKDQSPFDEEINDLINQILRNGGKRIRPLICLLSFEMISNKARDETSFAAACALEVIHNASLLVDDIFDKDIFRRNEKSFYLKYSTFAALSISYSMSSLALSLATKTKVIEVVDELVKTIHNLSSSLFLEAKFRSGKKKMLKEEALLLIDRKTSSLFEASSVIGGVLGTSSKVDRVNMKNYGKYFGRAFQLRDDLLAITSTSKDLGKSGALTDISNRIQTYIVLETMDLAKKEENDILIQYYLEKKQYSPQKIRKIIAKSASINLIKKEINRYISLAIEILEKYPQSEPRDKLISITKTLRIV
ncbi:MAG: polyprenyl synthetase family protein [Candidatus Heimdallarchaeota archaeon]|nr:polyprenyl synthetase family protein [Candidatus Heimdallarchaeota archaeon]